MKHSGHLTGMVAPVALAEQDPIPRSIRQTMHKPSFDPGFTEKYRGGLSRIINPSGEFNVRRRGTTWRDVHPYLFMINASWPVFSALIFGGFVLANVVFALIYVKIGVQHLQGADTSTALSRFLSAFFFSAQTFTTVGYGRISPDGVLTSMVASLQALLGLMALAIGTGLLFGRFSRPAARLAFSQQMVVAPYQSGTSLQFRMANRRSNNLMEIEVRVIMSTVESTEQGPIAEVQVRSRWNATRCSSCRSPGRSSIPLTSQARCGDKGPETWRSIKPSS